MITGNKNRTYRYGTSCFLGTNALIRGLKHRGSEAADSGEPAHRRFHTTR